MLGYRLRLLSVQKPFHQPIPESQISISRPRPDLNANAETIFLKVYSFLSANILPEYKSCCKNRKPIGTFHLNDLISNLLVK